MVFMNKYITKFNIYDSIKEPNLTLLKLFCYNIE
jgi:hypothetical protein